MRKKEEFQAKRKRKRRCCKREPRRLMKELIFNRHRVFVSVTRIDVVENYLQQETHSGGGELRDKGGRGKGDESGESGGK